MRPMPPKAVMARGIPAMFGAGPARFGAAVKLNCPYCFGLGWVCENHPHLPWKGSPKGCQCGAGMPCECNRAEGHEEPDSSGVISSKRTIQ
jgi:hypothetical protein